MLTTFFEFLLVLVTISRMNSNKFVLIIWIFLHSVYCSLFSTIFQIPLSFLENFSKITVVSFSENFNKYLWLEKSVWVYDLQERISTKCVQSKYSVCNPQHKSSVIYLCVYLVKEISVNPISHTIQNGCNLQKHKSS